MTEGTDVPDDLKYSKDHEWVKVEGDLVIVGITDYAQHSLHEITFVELPEVGTIVEAGEVIGNIESEKTESELISPVAGEVIEVNKQLEAEPELANTEPYDEGWMVKLQVDPIEFGRAILLGEDEYEELIG